MSDRYYNYSLLSLMREIDFLRHKIEKLESICYEIASKERSNWYRNGISNEWTPGLMIEDESDFLFNKDKIKEEPGWEK